MNILMIVTKHWFSNREGYIQKMRRLTEKYPNGGYKWSTFGLNVNPSTEKRLIGRYEDLGDIKHLKELTDAENDDRLIILPCKIGDKVFHVSSGCCRCENGTEDLSRCLQCSWCDEDGVIKYPTAFDYNMIELIGKTVFVDEADAETKIQKIYEKTNLPNNNV